VLNITSELAQALNVPEGQLPPVHNVEHHPAHLASAFFVSPFEEAAVVTIDAMGDFVSTSVARGNGRTMEVLNKVYYPHSLGILYTGITQFLGFPHYGDEYKVMGLAPYGEPAFTEEIKQLVTLKPKGEFELDLSYFRHWKEDFDMNWEDGAPSFGKVYTRQLEELLGPERAPSDDVTQRHKDIARSLQAVYEECAFHILNDAYERTGVTQVCLAGGCAMNSVANGKVRDHTLFTEVYIQPAAGDNGTALGAAYFVWHETLENERSFVMDHALWGTSYDDDHVPALVARQEDAAQRYTWTTYGDDEQVCARTAELIAAGNIVGWFQGRMEWGARALGNRSILADPRRADTRDQINAKIKFREMFRPFAPSIIEEAVDEYFIDAAPDPFMQQVYLVREDKREVIPAVTHEDGTGRLQAVPRETNPLYHRLISTFAEKTGVPVLLNTSFNENEPIVDTPAQALDCFFRTEMDAVVVGRTLVQRQRQAVADTDAPAA